MKLKRQGYDRKFECAGVYSIWIDNHLAYIGKSENMLMRMAQHYVEITKQSEKKYQILHEARTRGHYVHFEVMYYAEESDKSTIEEEIGQKEGELIRKYLPPLNTWIPQAENWHKTIRNPTIDTASLEQIIFP